MSYLINILVSILPIVSSIGMILMSYYIYRMSTLYTRKEDYLRYIVETYYCVENDSKVLVDLLENEDVSKDNATIEHLCRHISVNCTVMYYYIKRFPGYNSERQNLCHILLLISLKPMSSIHLYDNLSQKLVSFCLSIQKKRRDSVTFSIDPVKQGYAQEDF